MRRVTSIKNHCSNCISRGEYWKIWIVYQGSKTITRLIHQLSICKFFPIILNRWSKKSLIWVSSAKQPPEEKRKVRKQMKKDLLYSYLKASVSSGRKIKKIKRKIKIMESNSRKVTVLRESSRRNFIIGWKNCQLSLLTTFQSLCLFPYPRCQNNRHYQ